MGAVYITYEADDDTAQRHVGTLVWSFNIDISKTHNAIF